MSTIKVTNLKHESSAATTSLWIALGGLEWGLVRLIKRYRLVPGRQTLECRLTAPVNIN
jgi:hypothetical protein